MWYMHRDVTHNSIKLSPTMVSIAKIMLWMRNTRFNSKNTFKIWAAVHLKHHKYNDSEFDPHSPWYQSMWDVLYNRRAYIPEAEVNELTKHVKITTSWVDKYLDRYPYGPFALLFILLLSFPTVGPAIVCWGIVLIVYRVENLFNVIMHKFPGYVSIQSKKQGKARNVFPLFTLIYSGEELHGNHHSLPGLANNAVRWWEFDLSYLILRFLSIFGLVRFNKPVKVNNLKLKFIK